MIVERTVEVMVDLGASMVTVMIPPTVEVEASFVIVEASLVEVETLVIVDANAVLVAIE